MTQDVETATDETATDIDPLLRHVEKGAPARGFAKIPVRNLRVGAPIIEAAPAPHLGVMLSEGFARSHRQNVEEVRLAVREGVGQVHEVLTVDSSHAGGQRERKEVRRGVAPPSHPRRRSPDQVAVEGIDDVDRRLPTPRRDDGRNAGIGDEGVELSRPSPPGCTDAAAASQAFPFDDRESAVLEPPHDEVEAASMEIRNRGRQSRHGNSVSGA